MEVLYLILLTLLVNYFVIKKTNKIFIHISSCIILPLLPSIAYVWLEMTENDYGFWFQFLESGSFILSLISLPVIMGLLLWFILVYSFTLTFLIIEFFVIRRFNKNENYYKGVITLYTFCKHCKKSYIEESEDICVECAILLVDENESIAKYFDEKTADEVDGDTLNDLGASLSQKDY